MLAYAVTGTYIIDSFKASQRHQNTHALCNAAFALQMSTGGAVSSARVFFGGVCSRLFRASQTETALVGQQLTQVRPLLFLIQRIVSSLIRPITYVHPVPRIPELSTSQVQ